ncbi:hypothetical protein DTW90_35900 [Neorhizobium sp. P12A]|nr:hypothetical protein DTW90_35900 [Neorhizobium sp. P12A]
MIAQRRDGGRVDAVALPAQKQDGDPHSAAQVLRQIDGVLCFSDRSETQQRREPDKRPEAVACVDRRAMRAAAIKKACPPRIIASHCL